MRFSLRSLAAGLLLSASVSWLAASPVGPAAPAAAPSLEAQFRSIALPQNTSPALAQDRAGFIWVATSKGLARYDGYRLRPIEQAGDTAAQRNLGWVRALAAGRDGRMWIGTEFQGLKAYLPGPDRVEAHGSAHQPAAPIRALAEDAQGQVWIGSLGQGLQRYSPDSRRFEPQDLRGPDGQPEARVLALAVGRSEINRNTVWAGHWRGLSRRQGAGGRWEALPLPGLEKQGVPVLALAEDREGRLWFGTQDGRLGVVEPQGQPRWVQPGLQTPIQALAEAEDGRLWVGSKSGLLWLDRASGAIVARLRHDPRRSAGLAGNDISGLLRDAGGAMWLSGYGLGLQRHLHHPALAVRGPDADPASALAEADVRVLLALRSGELLAPTQAGVIARLDGRPGQALQTLGRWPRERSSVVEALAEAADGSLWMAAAGRLERRAPDGRLLRDWPLDGGRAQRLLLRASGEIWLGMQEGLYRLAGPQAAALQRVHLADGLPLLGGIYALIEDRAADGATQLWVGGQQGLFRAQGQDPAQAALRAVPQAPGASLGSPVVMGLLRGRDGGLWVDTPVSGLHRLSGWDSAGRARFERISERLGMEGVFGGNLHEDAQGRIWSQLYVYDPRSDRIDSFGAAEGAAFGSFWFFASTELADGSLLFGGSRGLLRIQPQAYRPPSGTTPLVISTLRVNGQPHPLPAGDAPQGLLLPAGSRSLAVEFAGLDYADPGRLRYQYRLQGLDNEWTLTDAGARNPSFGPLKPGRYTLQVRVSAQPGLWSPAELALPIQLLPHWWQTLWAQLAAVVLLLAAIWAWVRWRTRQLRQREIALQALVDERTAELREASLTDSLTGLRNRRYLELRLSDDLRLALRRFEQETEPGPDSDLLLMLLDLDHFKRVNDVHGHAAGDAVLVQLAQRLRRVFRASDSLVRWGGEEVLVLVRETHRAEAAELAERACAAVRERPFDIGGGRTLRVTVSIGFAVFPLDPQRPRAWDWPACLSLADSALYAAKARGRDGYVGALRAEDLPSAQAPRSLDDWQRGDSRLSVCLGGPGLAKPTA